VELPSRRSIHKLFRRRPWALPLITAISEYKKFAIINLKPSILPAGRQSELGQQREMSNYHPSYTTELQNSMSITIANRSRKKLMAEQYATPQSKNY
jgi:hypothetical protein